MFFEEKMQKMKQFFVGIFTWLWARKWRTLAALLVMAGIAYWGYKKYFPEEVDQTFVSNEYTVMT